jgi:predicted PurR-regulated permease PerM
MMDPYQAEPDDVQRNLWRQISQYLLILVIVTICILIVYPFLLALTGAIVLAVVTQHPYKWLTLKIGNRNASAALALFLVIVTIIIPSFFIAQELVDRTSTLITFLRSDVPQQTVIGFFINHPTIGRDLQSITGNFDLQSTTRSMAADIASFLAGALGHSFRKLIQIVVLVETLFFLYRDRDLAISFARSLPPLNEPEADELLENVRLTIQATALGRLALAGVQGILAGLAFRVLGVPNALLWTFATIIVAILPAVGPTLVWIPVALYLGFSGHWGKAALLAAWGMFVLSTVENLLYPMLVGSQIRQHTVSILLAMLGGVVVFGISGLILGPVVFTIATTLRDFWRRRTIM